MTKRSSLYDQTDSFGWISIVLHWVTTVAIVALWLIGQSIMSQPAEEIDARRSLHISLGLIVWLPLAGRIIWRLLMAHPHAAGQTPFIHQLAKFTHYLILTTLALMIVSGPLLAWTLAGSSTAASIVGTLHANAAIVLLILIGLHVAGALKHLMFSDDETIARIFIPRSKQKKAVPME